MATNTHSMAISGLREIAPRVTDSDANAISCIRKSLRSWVRMFFLRSLERSLADSTAGPPHQPRGLLHMTFMFQH